MKTQDAKDLAGNGKKLAALLGCSEGAVSQWGEDLPQHREWQLRLLKPSWFRKKKVDPVPPQEIA